MDWELSNGFSISLMKFGSNKYPTLYVKKPDDNVYVAVGSIRNPELLRNALSFYGENKNVQKITNI